MKVAVSTTGNSLDSPVDPRFGRSQNYLIIETDDMEYEAISNPNITAGSGAGIASAQLVAQKGVEAVITGNVGPNAVQVLTQAGIKIVTGATGKAREAVEKYERGDLRATSQAYGAGTFGGRGGGRGMGMGRGMGRGMGQGMYPYQQPTQQPTQTQRNIPAEEEREMLKNRLEQLEDELKEIKKRLDELD